MVALTSQDVGSRFVFYFRFLNIGRVFLSFPSLRMDVCTTAVLPVIGVIEIHVDGLSLSKSILSEEKGK